MVTIFILVNLKDCLVKIAPPTKTDYSLTPKLSAKILVLKQEENLVEVV